jgi:hypothetical protein
LTAPAEEAIHVPTVIPVPVVKPLACKHCNRRTYSSRDVARAEGWRTFQGKSVTGKDLDDVICPICSGTATPVDAGEVWTVGCSTCDWVSTEDDDEPILDAPDAMAVATDHRCQPKVYIVDPQGIRSRLEYGKVVPE